MSASGWFLMLASWVTIISLFVFCLYKVFANNGSSEK